MIRYPIKINVQSERERYENIVFTTGDTRGYQLEFSFYENGARMDLSGCALTVKSKRADGAVIIDSGSVEADTAYYLVADNAYDVPGTLEMEVALVRGNGSYVTVNVITVQVREGFGEEGLSSEGNEPVLANLEAQAIQTQAAVNSHIQDPQAHAEIFQSERETFNPLYANALIGTKEGANITLDDANSGCPVYVTIYGKCTETLESPDAEKSPDNPATITGIGESGSVTVTIKGKNLFDADTLCNRMRAQAAKNGYDPTYVADDNVSFDGRTCVRCNQLGTAFGTPFFENGKPNVQYTFTMWVYTNHDTGGIMVNAEYTDGTTTYTQITKHKEWEQHTLTTTAGKTVKRIYLSYTAAAVTLFDKNGMMLNEGSQPLAYEAYDREDIAVPLDSPLYGIKHPTTGEWLARDEIRVKDGNVQVIYNIVKYDVSGTETNTSSLSTTLSAFVPEVWNVLALNDLSEMCYAVISTHIQSNGVYNKGVNLGYQGDYISYIKMDIPIVYTGITQDDSSEQRVTKLKAWFSSLYSSDTPLTCYYAANTPTVTDITDTEAGQALLALVSQNGAVYTNSENADMKVTYNRDINKALEDVLAAGAAAALESDYRLSKMELGLN